MEIFTAEIRTTFPLNASPKLTFPSWGWMAPVSAKDDKDLETSTPQGLSHEDEETRIQLDLEKHDAEQDRA